MKIPNPDQYLKRHSSLDAPRKGLWRELQEFRPHVVVAASKGGASRRGPAAIPLRHHYEAWRYFVMHIRTCKIELKAYFR